MNFSRNIFLDGGELKCAVSDCDGVFNSLLNQKFSFIAETQIKPMITPVGFRYAGYNIIGK